MFKTSRLLRELTENLYKIKKLQYQRRDNRLSVIATKIEAYILDVGSKDFIDKNKADEIRDWLFLINNFSYVKENNKKVA